MRLRRPRRDGQAPGDGLVGQPLGDQFGDLELAVGQPRPRARRLAQETEHRIQDCCPVAVVEQVARTRQRDQRRPGDQRRDLPPQLEPGTPVPLAVQYRGARPDRRKQGPDVGVVIDLQQPGGHGRRSAGLLGPGEGRHLVSGGIGDEGTGQRLQPETPMSSHQRHHRVPDRGGCQVPPAGAHPVQHQRLDPVRACRRDRGGQLAALRGAEQPEAIGAHRVCHRQRRGHLPVERQVDPVPVRQSAPGLVVADHGESLGQTLDKGAEGVQLKLPAQMGDPARLEQQRRASARRRVGDAARGRSTVPDPRPHASRLAPPAISVKKQQRADTTLILRGASRSWRARTSDTARAYDVLTLGHRRRTAPRAERLGHSGYPGVAGSMSGCPRFVATTGKASRGG